jgi:hypothetical protein
VKGKSPREAEEPDLVFTVSVALAPPDAGVFDAGEKELVASEGRPKTLSVSAGMVPVDPATRVKVTVYVALVPRSAVKLDVIVIV